MQTHLTNLNRPRKALIIGGSLSGLFVGTMLRSIGWDVAIYERSTSSLYGRGAGIVLQPKVGELYRALGASIDKLVVPSRQQAVYDVMGHLIDQKPATQIQTSWSNLYSSLRNLFPAEQYHQGKTLTHFAQNGKMVTAYFEDGTKAKGDLLIGADGSRSAVRRLVNAANMPDYAGYIAWRGMIRHEDVPDEARELLFNFASSTNAQSHILGYSVPLPDRSAAYNWVWYRPIEEEIELPDLVTDRTGKAGRYSIPPGRLTDRWLNRMDRDADALLPPQFRALVHATPEPFAQGILDLTSEQTVHNRVLLLGEAAFILRPHMGIGTSKAAADALGLAAQLNLQTTDSEIDRALFAWQKDQIDLGKKLYEQGVDAGSRLISDLPFTGVQLEGTGR